MATHLTLEVFGEVIPVHRMTAMAQRISSCIAGSISPAFAGFVWYRPQGPFQQGRGREDIRATSITLSEEDALCVLGTGDQQDAHLFSIRERAQLLFLRWLYQSGHFDQTACHA
jgi:hypothetical protein